LHAYFGKQEVTVACSEACPEPQTLEFAYEVIAGTVHEGPHFLISLFSPPYMLFLAFFNTKLESTTLVLSRRTYFGQSLNGKGEFDF
jgi:hypothetical protein